jgi:hypothetical protein
MGARRKDIWRGYTAARGGVFIIDADSNEQVEQLITSLPYWGLVKVDVKPLISTRSMLERSRAMSQRLPPRGFRPNRGLFYSLTLQPGYRSGVVCVWVLDTMGARGMSVANIIGQAAEFPVGFLLLCSVVAVATAVLTLGIFICAKHEGKLRR